MNPDRTCPDCGGSKDTPITYTYCTRCTDRRLDGPDAVRTARRERDEARAERAEFVRQVTERLNRLGVPACPSWPEAFDWLEAEVERLRGENERLRSVVRDAARTRRSEAWGVVSVAARDLLGHMDIEVDMDGGRSS